MEFKYSSAICIAWSGPQYHTAFLAAGLLGPNARNSSVRARSPVLRVMLAPPRLISGVLRRPPKFCRSNPPIEPVGEFTSHASRPRIEAPTPALDPATTR